MSREHTPGQWHFDGPWIVAPDPKAVVADIYLAEVIDADECGRFEQSDERRTANGLLMAAAPDMAAVLRDVAALLPAAARLHPDDLMRLQTRVCNALAKAGVS